VKKNYLYIAFFCITISENPVNWKLTKKEPGLEIYTSESAESNFKMVRAMVELEASPAQVAAVILDVADYTSWGYQCIDSRLLLKPRPNELVYYYVSNAPWPVTNRDLVAQMKATKLSEDEILIESHNINKIIPEKKEFVRVVQSNATWRIKKKSQTISTAEFQVKLNPGGTIPSWIVNLFLTDGPYNTLKSMRLQVKKSKYENITMSQIFPSK
jgi:hypothetical protein